MNVIAAVTAVTNEAAALTQAAMTIGVSFPGLAAELAPQNRKGRQTHLGHVG
jgi:hypothetical protein